MTEASMVKDKNSLDLLDSLTAADVMTPNPVSIRGDASVGEATVLFAEHGFLGLQPSSTSSRQADRRRYQHRLTHS